jgi:putative phosphoribosyl transferase
MGFRDRRDAGRRLAEELAEFADRPDVVVLGLPRGGVPVAYEVARALHAPQDLFLVRKVGVPGHEELAMGAVAGGGTQVLDQRLIQALGLDRETVAASVRREQRELERQERLYRAGGPGYEISSRSVLVVDDGLATGWSMRAAVTAMRLMGPSEVVVAVPVAPSQTCDELAAVADCVVCLNKPERFHAVGLWYDHFGQTTDEEVIALLARAREEPEAESRPGPSRPQGCEARLAGQ